MLDQDLLDSFHVPIGQVQDPHGATHLVQVPLGTCYVDTCD